MNQLSSRFQCALVNHIAFANINVECSKIRLPAPLQPRAAATDHHHRIAYANLSVTPTPASDGTEGFLRAECRFYEVNQLIRILYHYILCKCEIAFRNR